MDDPKDLRAVSDALWAKMTSRLTRDVTAKADHLGRVSVWWISPDPAKLLADLKADRVPDLLDR